MRMLVDSWNSVFRSTFEDGASISVTTGCETPKVSMAGSVPIAALASVCVLTVAYRARLPLLAGAALYLFFAVESDLRSSRIPNWLNASGLLASLSGAYVLSGVPGLGIAAGGAVLAFLLGFALFAAGVLGAGDAKGIIVLGALHGAAAVVGLYLWMLLAGAFVAVVLLIGRGELRDFLERWAHSLGEMVRSGRIVHRMPPAGSAAAGGLPFAVCMAAATVAQGTWGKPW